jgi:hypothetical protein
LCVSQHQRFFWRLQQTTHRKHLSKRTDGLSVDVEFARLYAATAERTLKVLMSVLLKKLFDQSTHQFKELQRLLTNNGTRWIFNPPGAPHMGDKWQTAVKSVKHHLRGTIADTVLTYEDFSILLPQVKAILNSRPLSALSGDPEDISVLTPGHFSFMLLLSPRFQSQLSLICQTHDFLTFRGAKQDSKNFGVDGPQNVCKLIS